MNQQRLDQAGIRGLFLVWGYPKGSHRSQLMAKLFGMPCEHVYVTARQGIFSALLRYPLQAVMTVGVFLRHRPQVVFVQNPPLFPAGLAYLWGSLTGTKFIIDSHTDALLASWWEWTLPYHAFLSRQAITTLVTNEHLAKIVREWDAPVTILVDPPETHQERATVPLAEDRFHLVFVSGVSYDEPIEAVFSAAQQLPDVQFHVSGNFDKTPQHQAWKASAPDNVRFTGFIADEEFYGLLEAADAVMSLTTEDHTIQSGASEALWLGRPVITSDWPVLRNYFTQGAVLVDNSPTGIVDAITTIRNDQPRFEAEIKALQTQRRDEWWARAGQLLEAVKRSVNRDKESGLG